MCSEMVLDLVSAGVASRTGRDAAWATSRFDELCVLLSCSTGELVRMGRGDELAALCSMEDRAVARALVDLRLALPGGVDAGRLAAAAPQLLLDGGARARLRGDYVELQAMFAPSPAAAEELPWAVLEEPALLLDVAATDEALRALLLLLPPDEDARLALLMDTRMLKEAHRPLPRSATAPVQG
jgi:hypothetical protein